MSLHNSRILIIQQGALGDLVCTFPALVLLQAQHGCSLDLLCGRSLGALAQNLGIVDNYLPFECAYFATLFGRPSREALDILIRYHAIVIISRFGELAKNLASYFPGKISLLRSRPFPTVQIRVSDFIIEEFCRAGLLDNVTRSDIDKIVKGFGYRCAIQSPSRQDHVIFLHPGSGSRRKMWPLEQFCLLADILEQDGIGMPEFLLGPAEINFKNKLRNRWKVISPESLVDLLNILIQGDILIGNDSGISHLAAFLGLSVIAVFGPSDPLRWAPQGKTVVVRGDTACKPCFETSETNCDAPRCLDYVSVEHVRLMVNKKL